MPARPLRQIHRQPLHLRLLEQPIHMPSGELSIQSTTPRAVLSMDPESLLRPSRLHQTWQTRLSVRWLCTSNTTQEIFDLNA